MVYADLFAVRLDIAPPVPSAFWRRAANVLRLTGRNEPKLWNYQRPNRFEWLGTARTDYRRIQVVTSLEAATGAANSILVSHKFLTGPLLQTS